MEFNLPRLLAMMRLSANPAPPDYVPPTGPAPAVPSYTRILAALNRPTPAQQERFHAHNLPRMVLQDPPAELLPNAPLKQGKLPPMRGQKYV